MEYIPLGVIGIIGPWNYPIMCVFGPLAGILAAGNRAIIKPSEFTPRTSALLARLIAETFTPVKSRSCKVKLRRVLYSRQRHLTI